MEDLRPERGIIERQRDLVTITMMLRAIVEGQANPSYPEPMKRELDMRLGQMLLLSLPSVVTEVDLGTTTVSRVAADMDRVLPELRQTWNLQRVDEYGAQLASGLGKPYTPQVPPTPTPPTA